jgi:dTDP-4-dehydrorhamnose 3,5-epimerase-like enzyme
VEIKKIRSYVQRHENRGAFTGIINRGTWQEVNYVQTQAGAIRGNHYHKEIHEVVFLLRGHVEVEFLDVNDPTQKATFYLTDGEGIEIEPYVLHTMKYLTDCEQISLLDRPFDPNNQDLHTLAQ